MMTRKQLADYLDNLLETDQFRDYCPNGVQVEGKEQLEFIVAGVTASQALLDYAVEAGADAVLVHHGYFWKGESPVIAGMKRRRLKTLLDNEINLMAYHLPLDGHARLGNNAQLGEVLEIESVDRFDHNGVQNLIWRGELAQAMSPQAFAQHIGHKLGREPLHLNADGVDQIRRVAWCTGGAQNYIEVAAELGVDAYISGEASEQNMHQAQELGIHYYAAGHHATERYGVKALAAHLSDKFNIKTEFIDLDNPV